MAKHFHRIFAIGDIHGCAVELEALLETLAPKAGDLVIFLGDYVDRGPDSARVIDIILDLSRKVDVVALKGNHEAMFLDFLNFPESAGAGLFVLNGGTLTLASYSRKQIAAQNSDAIKGQSGSKSEEAFVIPKDHLDFFNHLQLYYETEDYFFVHAGVPEMSLEQIRLPDHELDLLWSRYPFLSSNFPWEKLVVHGHTPTQNAEIKFNRINVDTGCVYGGRLTAIELPAMKLHSVVKGTHPTTQTKFESGKLDADENRSAVRFRGRVPVRAQTSSGQAVELETLNYNQYGLLLCDQNEAQEPVFESGDSIEGVIGLIPETAVRFSGEVVRVESRGSVNYYGVNLTSISNEDDGKEWIGHSE